jgi:hypothetical protein
MVKTTLSLKAISLLQAAGWDGVGNRDIERDLEDLRYDEFDPPPDYIISFLREFSGVEFEFFSKAGETHYLVNFGLDKALEIPRVRFDLAEHSIILGKYLYPIGALDSYAVKVGQPKNYWRYWGRETIAVADDRSVYTSLSYRVCQEGYSINDFINRVVDDNFLSGTSEEMAIRYSQNDPRIKELQIQERKKQRLKRKAQED